ncbi:cobalamin B12-binding domain-containing protein [Palleronia sp. KMU-117]|uniref:cobalamin B12-binding domain-containing protein n=1 Tax=Palleronia sp. KMU-117 TaxID=3434108 RepID=UPI003D7212E2
MFRLDFLNCRSDGEASPSANMSIFFDIPRPVSETARKVTSAESTACRRQESLMSERLEELREIVENPGTIDLGPAETQSRSSSAARGGATLAERRRVATERLSEQFVRALQDAVLRDEADLAGTVLAAMRDTRVRSHDVIDQYIPEVARRLGEDWHQNRRSFADVTIGTARLQCLLREMAAQGPGDAIRDADAPGVAVIVLENEFHTLGAMVLGQQLRRAGVSVQMIVGQTEAEIVQSVAQDRFDAILVSVSRPERLASVRKLVEKLRDATVTATPVVIGGRAVGDEGEIRTLTGADHVATDAQDALLKCGLRTYLQGAGLRANTA